MTVDHCSGHLRGILQSVQSAPIQDVDAASSVDQNLLHLTVADMHGDDHSVIVRKVHNIGVGVREQDWSARG